MTATALLIASMLTASSLSAAKVAVLPVRGTNLAPGRGEAIGAVFAQQYAKALGADVLDPSQTAERLSLALGQSPGEAEQALGVLEYVELSVVALEKKIMISAVRRLRTGEQVYRADMAALGLDDITEVCERLALALAGKVPVPETLTLDNVTRAEGQAPNKTFSHKGMGLKTSAGYAVGFSPFATLGFAARREGGSYFTEVGAGAMTPASTSGTQGYGGVYAEIGASYYLLNASVSPYVGGGVSPRLMLGGASGIGVAPYLQGGVMLMRQAKTRVYADVRVAQNVLPVTSGTFPTEATLQIGVGF
jgi:hypothetical protein